MEIRSPLKRVLRHFAVCFLVAKAGGMYVSLYPACAIHLTFQVQVCDICIHMYIFIYIYLDSLLGR